MFCLIGVIFLLAPAELAAGAVLDVGNTFPEVVLNVEDEDDARYLDVGGIMDLVMGSKKITIHDVKTNFLVIQIFSMYCPYCQADAPRVNTLFGKMRKDPAINDKVKLIGIGAGNTKLEVATFKNKYAIDFPLFSDGDFSIHKKIGEVRTPYFIIVKLQGARKGEVLYSRLGTLESVESFLDVIEKLAVK
ncbi:MAG: redoxin domain-containing protein [Deltaproteobacteria bacterium]|nr:redoxin domain-containing protein [Deltaproteobacteria bacterium]